MEGEQCFLRFRNVFEQHVLSRLDLRSLMSFAVTCRGLHRWVCSLPRTFWQVGPRHRLNMIPSCHAAGTSLTGTSLTRVEGFVCPEPQLIVARQLGHLSGATCRLLGHRQPQCTSSHSLFYTAGHAGSWSGVSPCRNLTIICRHHGHLAGSVHPAQGHLGRARRDTAASRVAARPA